MTLADGHSPGEAKGKPIRDENEYYLDLVRDHEIKFIFVTGGVLSSLGKGLAAASLGCLLKSMGYRVAMQKMDPYLNTDAGTMNPLQHGEVYVTGDGAETDMDLGHYERFLDLSLSNDSCFTSGYIYKSVFDRERRGAEGDYKGKTVQIVPHVTDMIKHMILRLAAKDPPPKIIIVEIGGTVGDIEGLPFLEAVQELRADLFSRYLEDPLKANVQKGAGLGKKSPAFWRRVNPSPPLPLDIQAVLPQDIGQGPAPEAGPGPASVAGPNSLNGARPVAKFLTSNSISIHLSYLPFLKGSGETKTKPTQHSVKELRAAGLRPDIIICRSDEEISDSSIKKVARTCALPIERVIRSNQLDDVYSLPQHFADQGLPQKVCDLLGLDSKRPVDIGPLNDFSARLKSIKKCENALQIAVVGKYVEQDSEPLQPLPAPDPDSAPRSRDEYLESYKSVTEALTHAGVSLDRHVEIHLLDADDLALETVLHESERLGRTVKADDLDPKVLVDAVGKKLKDFDGILVPGGFGLRGTNSMIAAIMYAREAKKPFFGICFGMQLAVVEFARNVLGHDHARSQEVTHEIEKEQMRKQEELTYERDAGKRRKLNEEIVRLDGMKDKVAEHFIYFMPNWYDYLTDDMKKRHINDDKGGTMRLGVHPCFLYPDTKAFKAYNDLYDEGCRSANATGRLDYAYNEPPLNLAFNAFGWKPVSKRQNELNELTLHADRLGLLTVYERHRHRYEVNPEPDANLLALLTKGKNGLKLVASGKSPELEGCADLIEIMELDPHPWFVGCQFHPEFLSRPLRPHPLFHGFVKAAIAYHDNPDERGSHSADDTAEPHAPDA
ncbi:MAG: CTP synthase [Deltaproteobacteria bacterium]|jgi:CTP synthase|nr:CTP synthase [Deltaproteobacteria bacterium]